MPRRRRGGGRLTVEKYLREFMLGAMILVLAATIMLIGGAAANALSAYGAYNLTIAGNTVTVDLGFIPGLIVAFGSVLLFLYGFRKIIRTRI